MPLSTDHSDRIYTQKGDVRDIEENLAQILLTKMFEEDNDFALEDVEVVTGNPKRTGIERAPCLAVWVDDVDFKSPTIGQQLDSKSIRGPDRRKKANIYKRFLANVLYMEDPSVDPHATEDRIKWICEEALTVIFAHQNINNVCNGPFELIDMNFDDEPMRVDGRRQMVSTGRIKVVYSKTSKMSTSEKR